MYQSSGAKQYQQNNIQAKVLEADSHGLITLLLDGAIEKITQARHYIEAKEIAKKAEYIIWGMQIIEGLQLSIDKSQSSDLGENLDGLYQYMLAKLASANAENDIQSLEEVLSLLNTIRSGWVGIEQSVKAAPEASLDTQVSA